MAYLTEGDLENHILQDIDSSHATWISTIIGFVEDYINKYCGQDFENSGSTTRYYDGGGCNEQVLDDLQSVSSVQVLSVDGNVEVTLTENTDFWLYPLNETDKNKIVLSGVGNISEFPERKRALKVTGVFGHASVPGPVKFAAIQLAAKIINEGLRGGQVKSESLGSYSITYKDIDEVSESMGIKETLNQYRPITIF